MLTIILATLLWNGIGGLSLDVFTKNTGAKPPGGRGRFAQLDHRQCDDDRDWLYARRADWHSCGHISGRIWRRLAASLSVVRFVNDILLSAPSIIIGLFIYELLVASVGHISRPSPGAVALAVLRRADHGPHHRRHGGAEPWCRTL